MATGYFLCDISGFFKEKYDEDIEKYGVVIDEQDQLSEDSQNVTTTIINKCEERSRSSSRERL